MKILSFIITTMLFLAASVGCSGGDDADALTKAQQDSLRRIDSLALKIAITPAEDCLPLRVADSLHLFEAQNVDVHLKLLGSMADCREALQAGTVEGAAIDDVLLTELNSKETWLKSALTTTMNLQFLTSKKSRITRLAQLNDKVIAADRHGEARRMAESSLDSVGGKKQMAFVVQVEDLKVRLDMLLTGNVDAAVLPEPYASRAVKAGAKKIAEVKQKNQGCIAFNTRRLADKRRQQQYDAFLKAVKIANDSISKYGKEAYAGY